MSLPSRTIRPESGTNPPAMAVNSVDFPAPFDPISVTKSPRSRCSDTSSSAFFSLTVPGLNVLETCSMLSIFLRLPATFLIEQHLLLHRGVRNGDRHDDGGGKLS